MALSDHAVPKAHECRFAEVVDLLDDDDTNTMQRWIAERRACGAISRALAAEGYECHHDTIRKHLLSRCRCVADDVPFLGAWR